VPASPDPSFEEHLKALEKVVLDLEGDSLSLEASIGRYKQGVSHLAACRKILDSAEQRLCELVTTPGGVEEVPLRVGPEGLEDAPRAPNGAAPPRAEPRAARPAPPPASAPAAPPPVADPTRAAPRPPSVARPSASPSDLPF
jgi:exodeoxyribonuclease VII small subunit